MVEIKSFLPPVNEVWSKLIFSEASVILSTEGEGGGLCMMPLLAAWSHVPSRGVSVPGPMLHPGETLGGLCGESLSRRLFQQPPPRIRKASGTHPTGILSC